jgi:hypothetical protein
MSILNALTNFWYKEIHSFLYASSFSFPLFTLSSTSLLDSPFKCKIEVSLYFGFYFVSCYSLYFFWRKKFTALQIAFLEQERSVKLKKTYKTNLSSTGIKRKKKKKKKKEEEKKRKKEKKEEEKKKRRRRREINIFGIGPTHIQ